MEGKNKNKLNSICFKTTSAKLISTLLLFAASQNSIAGEIMYANNFTSSQRSQAEQCAKQDKSFMPQAVELSEKGDIVLTGMIKNKDGYMFTTMTNAYGRWMDFSPLDCDLRSEKEIADAKKSQKKKADAERAAREKRKKEHEEYKPIADLCLNKAISHDFTKYVSTASQHTSYKKSKGKVLNYSVAEANITIKYSYLVSGYFTNKKTGEDITLWGNYRSGDFTCETST